MPPEAPKPSPKLFAKRVQQGSHVGLPARVRHEQAIIGPSTLVVAGPLGELLPVTEPRDHQGRLVGHLVAGGDASPLIVLRRVALREASHPVQPEASQVLVQWAAQNKLGTSDGLVDAYIQRRRAAIKASGRCSAKVTLTPQWRMVVGIGERANPHEIGLSLHGTTGWPVIPGSSLKGVAAAWARQEKVNGNDYQRVFGHPITRFPANDFGQGSVTFLDALPMGAVDVVPDVVTPHFEREWLNPVPSLFLTVGTSRFEAQLTSRVQDDCNLAADWCKRAVDELGVGAKTGAGYGYLEVPA